jgi:hypothetical protein
VLARIVRATEGPAPYEGRVHQAARCERAIGCLVCSRATTGAQASNRSIARAGIV